MKTKIATALVASGLMFGTIKAQTLNTQGISLHYEVYGNPTNPPVLLISGLGGVGASWGPQIKKFAEKYYVILPDPYTQEHVFILSKGNNAGKPLRSYCAN